MFCRQAVTEGQESTKVESVELSEKCVKVNFRTNDKVHTESCMLTFSASVKELKRLVEMAEGVISGL